MNNNEEEKTTEYLVEPPVKPANTVVPASTAAPVAPVVQTTPAPTAAPAVSTAESTSNSVTEEKKFPLNKKWIFIITASLILVIVVTFVLVSGVLDSKGEKKEDKKTEETPEDNTNVGVIGDKEQDGLTFTNSSLKFTENSSTLTTIVKNTTSSDIEVRVFDIIVTDEMGNILVTLQGYVGGVIPAGESREIVSNVDMNLENAFDVEYKIVN